MERTSNDSRVERYKSALEKHDDKEVAQNLQNLNISEQDLYGKQTLDIGASDGSFARWANRHGGNVVSVDLYADQKEAKRITTTHTPYVIGNAINLPFADNSFDLVLSHASIPNVISVDPDEHIPIDAVSIEAHKRRAAAVREAVRVLKPGGEVRFAPVVRNERGTAAWLDRNVSMEAVIDELKLNPSLEVTEELLQKDEEGGGGIIRDVYRIIIRKRDFSS